MIKFLLSLGYNIEDLLLMKPADLQATYNRELRLTNQLAPALEVTEMQEVA